MIKLALKSGGFSLDYEGDGAFIKNELSHIIEALNTAKFATGMDGVALENGTSGTQAGIPTIPKHSTNTVAKLLNVSSGPDLILAAIAKIIVVDGADTANRKLLSAEMRKASSYFKRTYMNNLSAYLDTLTKADKIRLVSEDTYGLPAKERERIEHTISES